MNRRITALLLALVLGSTVIVSAFAAEKGAVPEFLRVKETEQADATEEPVEEKDTQESEEEEPVSPAGPDAKPEIDPKTGEVVERADYVPDAIGTVMYPNVERRIREKNLSMMALEENILALETLDYEEMERDLRDLLNGMADMQWGMLQAGSLPEEHPYYVEFDSFAYGQLGQVYESYDAKFEAIHNGDMQEDNEGIIRQLKDLQDQMVLGGEMLYMMLVELETQEASLQRQLAAMNRTVEEMELRYQMGQISALQLSETKAGQHAMASGLETLRMNISVYKTQLEMMIGAEMTGDIQLGLIPEVTEKQLESMDLEKDLESAKENSYELYAAEKEFEDAKETYEDEAEAYHYNEKRTMYQVAKHTWQAAQHTYDSKVQNYEYRFRTLYAQVKDYKQIYEASKVSLESEKLEYAAAELKYQQGTISKNVWLTAQDDLKTAEEKVQTSMNDLFSSYNTYCWAVRHGVLS